MQEFNTNIYDHDSEVNVAHKINSMELHNWINHLTYVRKELNNIISFYNSQALEKRKENKLITQKFEMKQVDNDVILSQLTHFDKDRTTIAECEDVQCDMSFIQEHEKYRRLYLYHIDKYRKLKDGFFNKIKDRLTLS